MEIQYQPHSLSIVLPGVPAPLRERTAREEVSERQNKAKRGTEDSDVLNASLENNIVSRIQDSG
jgi:hypothetical protein